MGIPHPAWNQLNSSRFATEKKLGCVSAPSLGGWVSPGPTQKLPFWYSGVQKTILEVLGVADSILEIHSFDSAKFYGKCSFHNNGISLIKH